MDNWNVLESMAMWLYGDGTLPLIACRIVMFVFIIEMFAHVMAIIGGAMRCSRD